MNAVVETLLILMTVLGIIGTVAILYLGVEFLIYIVKYGLKNVTYKLLELEWKKSE